MKTPVDDFDFHLPEELIAQYPAEKRGGSKLLVADRSSGEIVDKNFSDILSYIDSDTFLVVNDTKVMKARIFGEKPTGGKVEIFMLEDAGNNRFLALTRGKIKVGSEIMIGDNKVIIEEFLEDGVRVINFVGCCPYEVMERFGNIPLPPYIKREADKNDEENYQTVYSDNLGSVAAPTAGLHFTPEILAELQKKGVEVLHVTLNVGLGTFRPVKAEYLEDHIMHTEKIYISDYVASRINYLKKSGKKLLAVGTTSVRTLESAADENGEVLAGAMGTNLFISPGYKFRVVDKMVTNFHLPKSTLMVMISAFWRKEKVMEVYKHAVEKEYRFFSYGDAMLIL